MAGENPEDPRRAVLAPPARLSTGDVVPSLAQFLGSSAGEQLSRPVDQKSANGVPAHKSAGDLHEKTAFAARPEPAADQRAAASASLIQGMCRLP
jgi:hypothetical protein